MAGIYPGAGGGGLQGGTLFLGYDFTRACHARGDYWCFPGFCSLSGSDLDRGTLTDCAGTHYGTFIDVLCVLVIVSYPSRGVRSTGSLEEAALDHWVFVLLMPPISWPCQFHCAGGYFRVAAWPSYHSLMILLSTSFTRAASIDELYRSRSGALWLLEFSPETTRFRPFMIGYR